MTHQNPDPEETETRRIVDMRAPDYMGYLDTGGFFGLGAWSATRMAVSRLDF